jgi:hypothetical protein
VNCTAIRASLPEFALGVATSDDVSAVELHVEICAACRKEAIDLQRAAASFGYALAPFETPEPELEDRVVGAVRGVARPNGRSHRRGRRGGVLLLVAAIVVASFGVGSVFAARQAQQQAQATRDAAAQQSYLAKFGLLYSDLAPDTKIMTGTLAPRSGRGTGAALSIVSPSVEDRLIVLVNDMDDAATPLTVSISDTKGHVFSDVATIRRLDTTGGATVVAKVGGSLRGFVEVTVRDAHHHVVLRGTLTGQTVLASPSP